MNLYEDPVHVAGYACVWGSTYPVKGAWERIEPGAFDLSAAPVVTFEHDRARPMAGARHLSVWQDDFGLGFRFPVNAVVSPFWLMQSIRSGEFRSASVGLQVTKIDARHEGGRLVDIVQRATLLDVGLCLTGTAANPATGVWLDTEEVDDLPAELRHLRAHWRHGRARMALKARKPKAAARQPLHVQASARRRDAQMLVKIDRILADARASGRDLPMRVF